MHFGKMTLLVYVDDVIIEMALIEYWWNESGCKNVLGRGTTAAPHQPAFLWFYCLRPNACGEGVLG